MKHDQAAHLRRKINHTNKKNHGKTISIVSGKGGVGKSNIAINFSLELMNNRKKVLLFDLDVGMGNIDILLGLQAEYTVIDMLEKRLSVYDIIEHGPYNLAYIAGGSAINKLFSMDEAEANYFLEQYNELQHDYDYIIFDMGAGATNESMFFILASDECFAVTTPEPTSITDAYGMIKHIVNYKPKMPIYIIMNRCSTQKNGQKAMNRFRQVISRFLHIDGHPMGVLPHDKIVSMAVMRQI